jgi:intein-encoded DNA endonuclease-like protein
MKKSKLIKRFCLYCKKEFYTYPSQNCKFCSISCSGEAKAKIIPSFINLNKNLSYILGVLCGDGYLSKDKKSTYEIGLRTIDKDFALTFKSSLQKIFNLFPVIKIIPPGVCKIRGKLYKCKKQFKVVIFSKRIYNNLLKFDAIGKFKTKTWRIPKEIMNSKNEKIIGMFLRGFLDSEATAGEYCIEIASINKKGLNDIKYLLSKLGIRRFYFYEDWKNVWKLIISGKDNLFLIYQKIGFTIERKQSVLKNSVEYKRKIENFKESDYWNAIKLRIGGYTYREISGILKINTDTIRGWYKRGNMPYDIQRRMEIEGI